METQEIEGRRSQCVCVWEEKKRQILDEISHTHLSDFDRRADHGGDAGQRAAIATLGVSDHSAVAAFEGDFAELDPLAARHARLRLDDLLDTSEFKDLRLWAVFKEIKMITFLSGSETRMNAERVCGAVQAYFSVKTSPR